MLLAAQAGEGSGDGSSSGEAERRRAPRRKLPFGRGAILRVGDRSHIVGVVDISASGAYLSTRVEVTAGQALRLELLLPSGAGLALPCRLVRACQQPGVSRLRGLAVTFLELEGATRARLESFVARRAAR